MRLLFKYVAYLLLFSLLLTSLFVQNLMHIIKINFSKSLKYILKDVDISFYGNITEVSFCMKASSQFHKIPEIQHGTTGNNSLMETENCISRTVQREHNIVLSKQYTA